MNYNLYYLLLSMVEGLTPSKLNSLIEYFGDAKQCWVVTEKELMSVPGISAKVAAGILNKRSLDPEMELKKLKGMGINVIFEDDPFYPENLKHIYDPPKVLFYAGNIKILQSRMLAVVGARKATYYGLDMAETIARDLSEAGLCVVSGMARGIDTAAHRGALGAAGQTVAVLGCGIDVVYPRENRKLMAEIIERGIVISEFPPGTPPRAMNFPRRNRIISGLSEGILIVEAAIKSGSLITADFALEQGRDVFAVPGLVSNALSRGAHRLIKQGAKLVEEANDILEDLGIEQVGKSSPQKIRLNDLTNIEEKIYNIISDAPVSSEEIIVKLGVEPSEVLSALLTMELDGLVGKLPGQLYIRRAKAGLF